MKNVRILLILFLIMICGVIICCVEDGGGEKTLSDVGKFLQGEHEVVSMRFSDHNTVVEKYFMVEDGTMTYSWVTQSNVIAMTRMPINKVRVMYNIFQDRPIVKYRWSGSSGCNGNTSDLQETIDKYVRYALVVCQQEHWEFYGGSSGVQVLENTNDIY